MRVDSRAVLGVLLAVLVVASAIGGVVVLAGVAAAQSGENATETEATTADVEESRNTGPYGLEDLQQSGTERSNAPASVRKFGADGSVWLRHDRTSMFDRFLDDEELRTYVKPGTTVRRGHVYLGAFRGWSASGESLTLKVVYWDKGEVERQTEDGIVREEAAVNQRIDTVEVDLSGNGYEEKRVELRDHYEDAARVTVWVEGHRGDLQWTFKQQTSRAADAYPTDSRGDFVAYGALILLLPAGVVGGAGTYVGRKWLDRAGAAPGYDPTLYLGVEAFVLMFTALFAWDWLREVVATAPWLLGVLLGLNVAMLAVEWFGGDKSEKRLAMKMFDVANSEDHGDGSGTLGYQAREFRVATAKHGEVILKKGIRPFLARAFGAAPTLEARDGVTKTSLEATDDDTPWPEMYLIHPYAEGVVEHESERWEFDVVEPRPEDSRLPAWIPVVDWVPVAIAATFPIGGVFLGRALVSSALIGVTVGAIAALFWLSSPKAESTVIDLAPVAYDDVLANVVQTVKGLEETADRDWYRTKWHQSEAENTAKRLNDQEEGEVTRFEELVEKRNGDRPDRDDSDDVAEMRGAAGDD